MTRRISGCVNVSSASDKGRAEIRDDHGRRGSKHTGSGRSSVKNKPDLFPPFGRKSNKRAWGGIMRWLDRLRGADRGVQSVKPTGATDTPEAGKIPTTPLMLAVSISYMTSRNLAGILQTIDKAGGQRPTKEAIAHAFQELLCALYCLAVVILGEDESAHQMGTEAGGSFNLYTAAVFGELERPGGPIWLDTDRAWAGVGLSAEVLLDPKALELTCDEATELYLHDHPDLRTLADSAPEFCSQATQVEPALQRNNWSVTFLVKAWIRFAKALDLRGRSDYIRFLFAYFDFSPRLLASFDVFDKIRPVFFAE